MDVETLVTLHCLVLTWLAFQAAKDASSVVNGDSGDSVNGDSGDPVNADSGDPVNAFAASSQLPFLITGLQQTVLDGQPSLLVAVQWKKGKSCNGLAGSACNCSEKAFHHGSPEKAPSFHHGSPEKAPSFHHGSPEKAPSFHRTRSGSCSIAEDCDEMEGLLSSITLRSVLKPFLSMPSISDAITSSAISALNPVLMLSLGSLFSYQGDTSPLTTPVSFYWSSLYHPSSLPSKESLKSTNTTDTTVCTLNHTALGNPHLLYTVLSRVFASGLDLAGVRLLYGENSGPPSFLELTRSQADGPCGPLLPTLALALRGPNAVYGWTGVIGPDDSALAKVTDPTSVSAIFGRGLVHAVKNPYQSLAALAKWFGGRACLKTGTVFGMSDARTKSERRKRQRVRFSESESEDSISSPLPDVLFPPLISNPLA